MPFKQGISGAKFAQDLVVGHHLKCAFRTLARRVNTTDRISGLRLGKPAPIEAAISGARFSRLRPNAMQTGEHEA